MGKLTPEDRERLRRLQEEADAAHRRSEAIVDRIRARRREREERLERRRRFWRRLLPFRRAA
jgi:hypothetical protein